MLTGGFCPPSLGGTGTITPDVESRIYSWPSAAEGPLKQSQPQDRSVDAGRHYQQAIRRWGNSLAVRLPADCLRQAGLQEGDRIEIVVGPEGRLSLQPLQQLNRAELTADLRELHAAMPLTPSVIEEAREAERW